LKRRIEFLFTRDALVAQFIEQVAPFGAVGSQGTAADGHDLYEPIIEGHMKLWGDVPT
jgi:hypothetical protein